MDKKLVYGYSTLTGGEYGLGELVLAFDDGSQIVLPFLEWQEVQNVQ